jgi:hypothetical protein
VTLLLRFFVCLALLAFVQGAEQASATKLRVAQADQPKQDDIPPGGCTPIGLTARGDIVFPWQCRDLIEKQRGPISEEVPVAAPSVAAPSVTPSPVAPAKAAAAPQSNPAANVAAEPEEPKPGSREGRSSTSRRHVRRAQPPANPNVAGSIK